MTTIAPVNRLRLLRELERKVLWLSAWTVHHANHLRPNRDGLKVGGHQASCASLATVMTALYFSVLRPEDRVAVKPHASPVFHAIQYLFGHQTRDKLERFRALGGAQSYPSRTKDVDDVDFSTGSVGLGVAMTLFASLVQDYVRLKNLGDAERPGHEKRAGRMVALVGDAELDEGNIFEALLEGWKHDVRNLWWVIDYNRQSLDGVVNDRLFGRIGEMFELVGWRVVTLKYGKLLETAFAQPDGDHLRQWIDDCPNSLYSALVFMGGAGWREALTRDLNQYPGIRRILEQHDDAALHRLMTNLAGNDMQAVLDAFEGVSDDRPTCFIAYTIKGQGLPFAGHKDNHSGLMNLEQMASFKKGMAIADGQEWDKFAGLGAAPAELQAFIDAAPFNTEGRRRTDAPVVAIPAALPRPTDRKSSTQEGFGKILNAIAAEDSELAAAHRHDLARRHRLDQSRPVGEPARPVGPHRGRGRVPRAQGRVGPAVAQDAARPASRARHRREQPVHPARRHGPQPPDLRRAPAADRHALRSLHRARPRCAELRLLPGCALHDRGHAVGRDPGARRRRAPEHPHAADRHRPARAAHLRAGLCRRARGADAPRAGLHAAATRAARSISGCRPAACRSPSARCRPSSEADIVSGGYWYAAPERDADIAIVAMGAVTPEAIAAHESVARDFAGAGLLVLTSPDRLHADWLAAQRHRGRTVGRIDNTPSPVERLLAPLSRDARLVTVFDGHPLALSWLGSVRGQRVVPLGIESFGQSGDIPDLYRTYRLDTAAIIDAVARALA